MIRVLARMLGNVGDLRFALSGNDALRLARESVPDLILLDAELPDQSGFAICAELKQDPQFRDVPIIFVTSHRAQSDELDGFAAGAADFIAKPVSEPLLRARVATQLRVRELTTELRRLSTTDALTRVANRHVFDQILVAECSRASRGTPLAVLMVDVDHFKGYNDGYGHPAGDLCLQSVAKSLTTACSRAGDVVARVGGEEFAIVLPSTTLDGAVTVAARAGRLIRELGILHAHSGTAPVVTVSIGVAGYTARVVAPTGKTLDERASAGAEFPCTYAGDALRRAADQALYAAKHAGRDQVWMTDLSAEVPGPAWVRSEAAPQRTLESRTLATDDSYAA